MTASGGRTRCMRSSPPSVCAGRCWSAGRSAGAILRHYIMHYGDRGLGGHQFPFHAADRGPEHRRPGARKPCRRTRRATSRAASRTMWPSCVRATRSRRRRRISLRRSPINFMLPFEVRDAIGRLVNRSGGWCARHSPAVTVPTLITHGRRDQLILPRAAEMTAAAIKGATDLVLRRLRPRAVLRGRRPLQSRACGLRRQGQWRSPWLRNPSRSSTVWPRVWIAASAGSWKQQPPCWSWPRSSSCSLGILARYVFHRPLVWSDELASILFLWLAVLGSALAFRRGENLRMTTLVNKLSTASQQRLESIALAASLAFLVMIAAACRSSTSRSSRSSSRRRSRCR